MDRSAVEALVAALEGLYRSDNPYHNAAHAADVVQATWLFMRAASVQVPFTNLEVPFHSPWKRTMQLISS